MEATEGAAGTHGVFHDCHAAPDVFEARGSDRWQQLPHAARGDVWRQLREGVTSTAAELSRLASTVGDQVVLPWPRSILAARCQMTA